MKKIGKLVSSNLRKVTAIFRELEEKSTRVTSAQEAITQAFTEEFSAEVARDIAFHLIDWSCEAEFLVAVLLFPERFTEDEIKVGVVQFVIHAPNHMAAAAKLCGFPVTDVFKIGALDGRDDD